MVDYFQDSTCAIMIHIQYAPQTWWNWRRVNGKVKYLFSKFWRLAEIVLVHFQCAIREITQKPRMSHNSLNAQSLLRVRHQKPFQEVYTQCWSWNFPWKGIIRMVELFGIILFLDIKWVSAIDLQKTTLQWILCQNPYYRRHSLLQNLIFLKEK